MFFFGAAIGALSFFLLLLFANYKAQNRGKIEKISRNSNSSSVLNLNVATIAEDMLPLVTPNISSGAQVIVVGSDGFYTHSKNGRLLLKGIQKWLKIGARVDYLLLSENSQKAQRAFKTIEGSYPKSFSLSIIDPRNCEERCQELCNKYFEFHPVLVSNGDDSTMWIEGFHEQGVRFAYDVSFVSPSAMTQDKKDEFDEYYQELSELISFRASPETATILPIHTGEAA